MSFRRLKIIRGASVACNHCSAVAWYKGDPTEVKIGMSRDGWHDYAAVVRTQFGPRSVLLHICRHCQHAGKQARA